MSITQYQAQVITFELTRRKADAFNRVIDTLADIPVDLNPHQIDAAVVALNSPFSKGVILADEVGLGKTIEVGIVAAQMFSSGKKRQLVLCTPGLRKHWADQLTEHFHIPVRILDEQREDVASQLELPLQTQESAARCLLDEKRIQNNENDSLPEFDGVLIASYTFLNRYESLFAARTWDLLIIDEAHRLRKLYKDVLKTTQTVQKSLFADKTILITAFPLQYSLLDLYSLTQLIDDTIFGSEEVFRERFMLSNRPDFAELKRRLAPCLVRTLRRQVLEFVPMTKRTSLTAAYSPTAEQKKLYKAVADFFFRKDKFPGVPAAVQVMWITFVQKAMGSSVPALTGILQTIRQRLGEYGEDVSRRDAETQREGNFEEGDDENNFGDWENEEIAVNTFDITPSPKSSSLRPSAPARKNPSPEITRLDSFIEQANSLASDPKTDVLLTSLRTGFQRMKEVGANEKALVFTESLHTQQYLKEFLDANGYAGKIVVFNGQNNSPESRKIYRNWLLLNKGTGRICGVPGADLRQSLIDYFRDTASIMIATEAGAEGLDLQFCSFVVNYDLPFNPIQLEWRIGRCHRYGQKFDVVVVNFLNTDSLADRKAYELLSDRFSLFDGMFGSSDTVLGSLETGTQLEKKIARIMRTCRTEEEIESAFDDLQKECETQVRSQMATARQALFENMDSNVIERFQVRIGRVQNRLDHRTEIFWKLLKYYYRDKYWFDDTLFTFGFLGSKEAFYQLGTRRKPLSKEAILDTRRPKTTQPIPINPSDPTAQMIYKKIKAEKLPPARLEFHLSKECQGKYADLLRESQSGWLRFDIVSLDGFTQSDELVYTVCDASGQLLPPEFAQSLMESDAVISDQPYRNCPFVSELETALNRQVSELTQQMEQNGQAFFEEETAKIDRYASDLQLALELELRRLSKQIKILDESLKKQLSLKEKLEIQHQKSALKREQSEKTRSLLVKQDELRLRQDKLVEQIRNQLSGINLSVSPIFIIEWALKTSIMNNSMGLVTVPG
ncbi:MAG: DEAD/DEAH box helicase [Thermoguttaceae bacterium]|nr:DEAD/DEAH box helicase [Thermoguttaceae bacterium]